MIDIYSQHEVGGEADSWQAQRLTHTVIWYMYYLRSRRTRSLWRTRSHHMRSTSRRLTIPNWWPNRTLWRERWGGCSRRDAPRRRSSWRTRRSFKKRGSRWCSKFWRNLWVRCGSAGRAMGLVWKFWWPRFNKTTKSKLHYPANLRSQGLLWPEQQETLEKMGMKGATIVRRMAHDMSENIPDTLPFFGFLLGEEIWGDSGWQYRLSQWYTQKKKKL